MVACLPASGSKVPAGTTTVTCGATDASGNHALAVFHMAVPTVRPRSGARAGVNPWARPATRSSAKPHRSIPVKVEVFANGVEQRAGHAILTVARCVGVGPKLVLDLRRDHDRWTGKLKTTDLPGPGCYEASVSLDGQVAGSFGLDLGDGAAADKGRHMGNSRYHLARTVASPLIRHRDRMGAGRRAPRRSGAGWPSIEA